ncbi:hypothetical protein TTHERM_00285410 (macronuclear) [Tetrahymena thermophila SB210]|uniref:Uncharacterized protein n=1 Tax=Tetrahymena thermophila (strain SB210) TaxID=312017 RepID=I7LVI7_TETTS|nr:hypothetical protein TTHERM_00285410 [Tetrahymena thermophila SB210]EAR98310.3 hypothetical protein TTHERM_00285410 [Tetrahymena thermophila SB210]|eukprot:XP_001018555.3 hypothetical protein TTHERM_00285410 [Tetrahymena thermophila SB210]
MEVRGRAGTLCMTQYEREQFLITSELEGLAIADESQNGGDTIDQMPQILQNELRNSSKQQSLQCSKMINSGTADSSQQSNQN